VGRVGALGCIDEKKEDYMDFIERMFGISPDGGDGSTELILLTVFVLIAAVITWRWLSRRSSEKI
jgi:hypothetical protein